MVSISRIEHDIQLLAGSPRNSRENIEQHTKAVDWITSEFESIGLRTERQVFDIPQQSPARTGTNIIGELNHANSTSPSIVIGAHFDTVPGSPGADDNASGVAAMLECARVLADSASSASKRRVTFVAFDAEEIQPPIEGLHGSTAYVEEMLEKSRPSAAIIFESIGFSSSTIKQGLPGSFRILFRKAFKALKRQNFEANSLLILSKGTGRDISRQLEKSASTPDINLAILPLEVPWWMPVVRNLRRSDHAPFWLAGVPAVMISDTANFRNPHYHQPGDTPDTVDVDLVARAARTVLDAIERGAI
jgi:Zn-dependent M28 family amino/carboxypeptidase